MELHTNGVALFIIDALLPRVTFGPMKVGLRERRIAFQAERERQLAPLRLMAEHGGNPLLLDPLKLAVDRLTHAEGLAAAALLPCHEQLLPPMRWAALECFDADWKRLLIRPPITLLTRARSRRGHADALADAGRPLPESVRSLIELSCRIYAGELLAYQVELGRLRAVLSDDNWHPTNSEFYRILGLLDEMLYEHPAGSQQDPTTMLIMAS